MFFDLLDIARNPRDTFIPKISVSLSWRNLLICLQVSLGFCLLSSAAIFGMAIPGSWQLICLVPLGLLLGLYQGRPWIFLF